MSSLPLMAPANRLNSLAAFLLQRCGAVRTLVVFAVLAAAAPAAFAQGTGTCSSPLAGTVGIAFVDSNGEESVQALSVPNVFNAAECECPNSDLQLDIFLTAAFPSGTPGTAELWTGLSCDTSPSARITVGQIACEKIATLDFSQFVIGSTTTSGHIYVPIPTLSLFSPVTHVCAPNNVSNGIFVLFFSGANSSPAGAPYATCSIPGLTEEVQGPGAPTGLSASSGDGAVSLNWGSADVSEVQPTYYQVLCADANGNPISNSPKTNIYSACVPNGDCANPPCLERRPLQTGGSLTTATDDAGIGTSSAPLEPASAGSGAPPAPHPEDTDDGGLQDDGGTATLSPNTGLPEPFTYLDTRYACSDQIPVGSSGGSVRITGLTNGIPYSFVVVGVDTYGNATPNVNGVVTATPQPVEDLYRRFRDSGGGANGFCFIATAAYGSYENRWVRVLRQFRDEVLLPTHAGTSFVDWYYRHSPPAAAYISVRPTARAVTRIFLAPVIAFAATWLYVPGWLKLAFVLLCAGWLVQRRRRRLAARPTS